MQTISQRQRRTPSAPAPFSRTAAKLIKQIQADARSALLEELSANDGITVLHDLDAETKHISFRAEFVSVTDAHGAEIYFFRRRAEPEEWKNMPNMRGMWHPAHWVGARVLLDGYGVQWRSELPTMVCDDFGNLVEVAR